MKEFIICKSTEKSFMAFFDGWDNEMRLPSKAQYHALSIQSGTFNMFRRI